MAKKKIGVREGGAGQSRGHESGSVSTIEDLLLAVRAELDDLRADNAALKAKLDADAGITDTNYASGLTLAATEFEA